MRPATRRPAQRLRHKRRSVPRRSGPGCNWSTKRARAGRALHMPKIVENAILIYTDGSLYRKGLRGGYGFLFVYVDPLGNETTLDTHAPPGIGGTTGNRMELQACIDAFGKVSDFEQFAGVHQIVLRTDSQYVSEHYLNAFGSWPKSKWLNSKGRPIENADLWRDFAREFKKVRKRVVIEWVKRARKGQGQRPVQRSGGQAGEAIGQKSAESTRVSFIGSPKVSARRTKSAA